MEKVQRYVTKLVPKSKHLVYGDRLSALNLLVFYTHISQYSH